MSVKFKFDEKALLRAVQPQMERIARDLEADLARLQSTYRGRPVDEIRPAVRKLFSDGSISETEVEKYAQWISDGTKIEVRA